ncbi:hypothetical protein DYI25_18110 [Mesobacillus boroniphilus]|uniref:Uncharacterized protein n=1 Tax=Mesobacillus boroniphilus TaxID=308892 RepID=A0A944CNR4_9BACI|nr:hypothetical protein [Mesobacillus boroniphilus]MBS8266340.1 hypothetical protein [Mesobacillus boroniphilus]
MLETNVNATKNVRTVREDDSSLKKVLNIIGLFIFGGMALTSVTNAMPPDYMIEYFLFIAGSALIYYFLVNIYFLGQTWRKVFYGVISLLGVGSLIMAFYLVNHSSH